MDEKERIAETGEKDAPQQKVVLKKRGRPKGVKNKPKPTVEVKRFKPKQKVFIDASDFDGIGRKW